MEACLAEDEVEILRKGERGIVWVGFAHSSYRGPRAAMGALIERIMARRGHAPVAFDTSGSPFEPLRDSGSWDDHFDPRSSLGSVASGYPYLARGIGEGVGSAEEVNRLWLGP